MLKWLLWTKFEYCLDIFESSWCQQLLMLMSVPFGNRCGFMLCTSSAYMDWWVEKNQDSVGYLQKIICFCSEIILHCSVLCHCPVHHRDITSDFLQGGMQWFTDKSCILVIRLALWWYTLYIQTQVTLYRVLTSSTAKFQNHWLNLISH
jgi:hypothetical protein